MDLLKTTMVALTSDCCACACCENAKSTIGPRPEIARLKFKLQSVVGDEGVRRQILFRRMRHIVRDMREVGLLRLHARGGFDGALHVQVRGMWLMAKRIDNQDVH